MKILAVIFIRILSLYYFIKTISSVTNVVAYLPTMMKVETDLARGSILPMIIILVVNVAICVLLWVFSIKIADAIVPQEVLSEEMRIDLDYNKLLVICIKVIGLLLIILSAEDTIRGMILVISMDIDRLDIAQKSGLLVDVSFPFIKIMMGLILISNPKIHKLIGSSQL